MADPKLSAKAQQALGLPDGFKVFSPSPFGGMDTSASAIAIADTDFVWRENFIRQGDGSLRTLWDISPAIYTTGNSTRIIYFCFYTIGTNYYVAIFLNDGSAYQLDTTSLVKTTIATSGFYTNSGLLPFARQWGSQYLLICNRNTVNDYWIWDGSLLYKAGTAAPQGVNILSGGSNYSTLPTVSVYGGSGSGMALTPVISGGSVVELQITNPGHGYEVGDQPQVAFAGGGGDTSAILTAQLNAGGVGAVNITAGGSGYTSATVAFSGGGGSGATGVVQISTGVTAVSLTSGGSGYTYANITFSGGGGSGAAGTCTIASGVITGIVITATGFGYTSTPTATITGSGIGASVNVVTTSTGVVYGVSITNNGTGYTSAPTVTFSGTGTGATGVALLDPGGVASVTVVSGGTGFKSVPLITFVGGGGAGATGVAYLTPTSIASVEVTAGGSGYTSIPTVTFVGGGGSGATANIFMSGGSVASIQVTNGGSGYNNPVQVELTGGGGSGAGAVVLFQATSIASVLISSAGQYYTSAPSVEVSPGANTSAAATISLMPYGISGSAIETYLSRVWIINPAPSPFSTVPPGGQFSYSAADSVIDFATSDGGGSSINNDSFLQTQYVNVRQSSGYLYFFGDGSISVVSNVATSGSPTTTTYNYQNVDPQVGLSWRDSLQDFGRSTIVANATGISGLYGGAATKISSKMDGVFRTAVFPPFGGAITPSSAIATIYEIKHYLNLMTVIDPDTGAQRNVMVAWDEKTWFIASQSAAITFIGTEKVGSTYTAWGTDGVYLFPLFAVPNAALPKRLDTKAYGGDRPYILKELLGTWVAGSDLSTGAVGITGSMTAVMSGAAQVGGSVANQTWPSTIWYESLSLTSPTPYFATWGTAPESALPFTAATLRLTTTSPDFVLGNWVIGYKDATGVF